MKSIISVIALLLCLTASSAFTIDEEVFPFAHGFLPFPELHHYSETKNFGKSYDINITINLTSQATNFDGILFTSQQFDSLFPPMKDFNGPQNVSIHLYSKIKPFSILNFTDFHLALNLNLEVDILCPTVDNLFTTFNGTGYVQLQIIPVLRSLGFRLYIKDFNINDLIIPDSETSKIDRNAAFVSFNTLGQFGIDYVNHLLSQKLYAMSMDGYLVSDSDNYSFENQFVSINVQAVEEYF